MANNMKMTFSQVKKLGSKFKGYNQQLETMMKDMRGIISGTIDSGEWTGESAKAFKESYQQIEKSLKAFSETCKNTGVAVEKTAKGFEQADKDAANAFKK